MAVIYVPEGGDVVDLASGDVAYGSAKNDVIFGGLSGNVIYGGGGDDIIGVSSESVAFGGEGSDTLEAWEGTRSELHGGPGDDRLASYGNEGARLFGNEGNDILSVYGTSTVVVDGGSGNNTLKIVDVSGENLEWRFQDGGGTQNLGNVSFSNIQNISLYIDANESVIHGGSGNDTIVGIYGDHIFYGEGGDDFLDAGEGRGYLDGGAGNDKIVVRVGGYGADGGAGIDTVVLQPTIYSDTYTLNQREGYLGEDTYITGFEALEWQGGWGNDVVHGGNYSDRLDGGTYGNDSLYGEGGNDVLTGGYYGDDRLFGGDGNDTISGALFAGKDWIVGGRGSDTMTGAGGNDKFVFSASDMRKGDRDVITDFSAGDLILTTSKIRDGNGDGIISFGANRHLDYGAGTVEIRDGAGGTVTSLAYVGTETNAGVSYYVYSLHD